MKYNKQKIKNSFAPITINEIFSDEDFIFTKHKNNNKMGVLYIEKSLELALNKCWNCVAIEKINNQTFITFYSIYEEVLSSLINAYRLGLWGAVTDAYTILRVALEGLGFLNQIVIDEDFDKISILIENGKLKHKYIEQRCAKDKNILKTLYILADLSNHFTQKRLAQRVYTYNEKQLTRMGAAYYEIENNLTNRLAFMIDIVRFAIQVLAGFTKHYHTNCTYKMDKEINDLAEIYKQIKVINQS